MKKKILWLVAIGELLVIISLGRGVIKNREMGKVVREMKQEKTALEKKKKELEAKLKRVNSPEYIEWVAREKLHLAKPGEVVVIGK